LQILYPPFPLVVLVAGFREGHQSSCVLFPSILFCQGRGGSPVPFSSSCFCSLAQLFPLLQKYFLQSFAPFLTKCPRVSVKPASSIDSQTPLPNFPNFSPFPLFCRSFFFPPPPVLLTFPPLTRNISLLPLYCVLIFPP